MTVPYPFDCLPVHPPPAPLESFTGYMIRLAALNGLQSFTAVRMVLFDDRAFRPHLRSAYSDIVWRPFERFATASGCSLDQLKATTIAHLVVKFGSPTVYTFLRNSLASSLRYCPDCLRDSGYYRLDWRFLTLPGCERHGRCLLDHCGHCGQILPLLSPSCLHLDLCPFCQTELSRCVARLLNTQEYALTQHRTAELAYLLSPQDWELDARTIWARAGAYLCCLRQEQRLSSFQLARQLGVPQTHLRAIENQAARREGVCWPLRLAYIEALNTTWAATFHYVIQHPNLPTDPSQLRDQRLRQRLEEAIVAMEQFGQPLSKTALGRAVNLSHECFALYPKVQELMDTLPERVHQQQDQHWLTAAQTAITALQAAGLPVTLSAIYRRVPRFPRQLTHFPQLRSLLATYVSIPPTKPAPAAHPQEARVLQQLTSVTEQLSAQDQLVTIPMLARALSISLAAIYTYPSLHTHVIQAQQLCKLRQHQRADVRLTQQAQQVITEFTQQGRHYTITAICQALGKTHTVLVKYPQVAALFQQVKAAPSWPKSRH